MMQIPILPQIKMIHRQLLPIVKPFLTNGFAHHHLWTIPLPSFRGTRSYPNYSSHFFNENPLSKQNSPRWDPVFCGVTSGAVCLCPTKRTSGLNELLLISLSCSRSCWLSIEPHHEKQNKTDFCLCENKRLRSAVQ